MSKPAANAKQTRGTRNLRITPKGEAILAAVARGEYTFAVKGRNKRAKNGRFAA